MTIRRSRGGVVLTQYWKAGLVDYCKIPQLTGGDLGAYRGAARSETRITVTKPAT